MAIFDDDKLEFFDEYVEEEKIDYDNWNILIVDDEKIVHESTKMVLNDFVFQNKRINFLCAYNAEEAKTILKDHDDIAVVLLDVVMEKDNSGLELVRFIRDELKNKFIRIILRTGQPGQAPEEEVIVNYDINDYKMKTELTLQKLLTTIVSALRSYSNIMELELNRRGLENIIKVETDLYEVHHIKVFAELLLNRIQSIHHLEEDSCYMRSVMDESDHKRYKIIAGTGRFSDYAGKSLTVDQYNKMSHLFDGVFASKSHYETKDQYLSYYKSIDIIENYIYFEGLSNLDSNEKKLFKILISNLSVAVDNIALNEKLVQTQSELINRLSEVIEVRSEETASHVDRVSSIAYLLANKIGMAEDDAILLKTVAPLHDVGKIGISEKILNKPGKLTDDEYAIMKEHAMIGYRILKGSGLELLEAGAQVAREHHEHWNGNGYPDGISGENISINGRITIIADVFDALSHDRVYKKAWPFEEVMTFMKEQSGKMFDPRLIVALLESENQLRELYKKNHESTS